MPDPVAAYEARIKNDNLNDDPFQREVVNKFRGLAQRLQDHDLVKSPPRTGRAARMGGGFFGRLKNALTSEPENKPLAIQGMYLYGPVGTGKSMLMDIFAEAAGVPVKRVHFHSFLQDIHARINRLRKEKHGDPIPAIAESVTSGVRVFAFDEVQINDIADAMLVGRLFEAMFKRGIVLIATSNRHPNDLYKQGLNRHLFVPFIKLIEKNCEVVELDGGRDYRRGRLEGQQIYFSPINDKNKSDFNALWNELAGGDGEPLSLDRGGRSIDIAQHRNGAARDSFDALCRQPYGAGDYLALIDTIDVLFIEEIPQLSAQDHSPAIRFTNLVDVAYEAKKRLIILANAEPEDLYSKGSGSFEFERTASRLIEMQSADWETS